MTVSPPRPARSGAALLVLASAALAFRLPALAHPIGIDQGIFATAGWAITRGLSLYRDVWDQKPPGIHLTYAAASAVFDNAARMIVWLDLGAAIVTAVMLCLAARTLAGPRAGALAACLYAIGSMPAAIYSYGGFLERAVPETFISALAATAMWLAVRLREHNAPARAVAFGAAIGAAVLFKPTAALYVLLLAFAFTRRTESILRTLGWVAIGAAVPIGAATIWLAWHGALADAWTAVVVFNRAYLGIGFSLGRFLDAFVHEIWRRTKTDPFWALAACGWIAGAVQFARTRHANPMWTAGTLACAAATLAAAANGVRLYSTYFIPEAVGLALLAAGALLNPFDERRRLPVAGAIAAATAILVLVRSPEIPRGWTRTRADLAQLSGSGVPRTQYLEEFGGYGNGRGYSSRANDELAAFLRDRTAEDDRIYIFGMAPAVYVMSGRFPAQRFVWVGPAVSNLVDDPSFSAAALAGDLRRTQPAYIILERNNRDSLLGWTSQEKFEDPSIRKLMEDYAPDGTIEDFVLFRRQGRR